MLSCLKRINKRLDSFKGLFFFILIQITSYALEVGNIIHSDSASYLAIKELGKGDFGEVWMIEDVESHERYALKFFFNSPSQSTLNTYDLIPHLQSLEQLPHVLKTYAREYYTIFDTQGTEQIEGIRFQAAISNVEKLYEDHFSLINTFNTEVQKKEYLRLTNSLKTFSTVSWV
jgi:serine/threonine protein kinase